MQSVFDTHPMLVYKFYGNVLSLYNLRNIYYYANRHEIETITPWDQINAFIYYTTTNRRARGSYFLSLDGAQDSTVI